MVKVEKVSGRMGQFVDAVNNVKGGAWSAEEFLEFLQNMFVVLQEKRVGTEALIEESHYDEFCQEEVELGLQGMEQFEEGMQEMSLFLEDGEVAHLDVGLASINHGNELLNDAMRVNRASRRKLEDEWGLM